jgi:predicted PurR-regulated permease PerM
MEQSRIQSAFFIALFGLILILNVLIFKTYFGVLFLSLTLAVLFKPVYQKILKYLGREGFAAFVTTLIVFLVVVLPVTFLAQRIFFEARNFYGTLTATNSTFLSDVADKIKGLNNSSFSLDLNQYLRNGANSILQNVGSIFSSVVKLILTFTLMLLSLFFFFRDGEKLLEGVYALSPLPKDADDKVLRKMETAINSVIRGQMVVAVVQGLVAILGFTIFGVPNPVLLGCAVIIASFIPTIGTSLITFPSIAFLYFTGHTYAALGLFIWALSVVGLVDNVLAPIVINRNLKMHPFIILLAVLGGISAFGPIGFLLGPLVVTMLLALFEVRYILIKK